MREEFGWDMREEFGWMHSTMSDEMQDCQPSPVAINSRPSQELPKTLHVFSPHKGSATVIGQPVHARAFSVHELHSLPVFRESQPSLPKPTKAESLWTPKSWLKYVQYNAVQYSPVRSWHPRRVDPGRDQGPVNTEVADFDRISLGSRSLRP